MRNSITLSNVLCVSLVNSLERVVIHLYKVANLVIQLTCKSVYTEMKPIRRQILVSRHPVWFIDAVFRRKRLRKWITNLSQSVKSFPPHLHQQMRPRLTRKVHVYVKCVVNQFLLFIRLLSLRLSYATEFCIVLNPLQHKEKYHNLLYI